MSMLSSQADRLRKRALVLRQGDWSDGREDALLMEDAADTIESMRDRLQADAMGSGTCEANYDQDGIPRCSNCQNVLYDEYKDGLKNYCDECGRKVKR